MEIRPRRSALYMPGSNARALEKAKTLDADVVVFDLEDAVAPEVKAEARAQVAAAVRAGGYGRIERHLYGHVQDPYPVLRGGYPPGDCSHPLSERRNPRTAASGGASRSCRPGI